MMKTRSIKNCYELPLILPIIFCPRHRTCTENLSRTIILIILKNKKNERKALHVKSSKNVRSNNKMAALETNDALNE